MELISIRQAAQRLSISRTALWSLTKQPDFPKMVQVTPGRKAFVAAELDKWISSRIADRNARRSA
jgi:predicted DNA-binding transcriptional regulator AlpA